MNCARADLLHTVVPMETRLQPLSFVLSTVLLAFGPLTGCVHDHGHGRPPAVAAATTTDTATPALRTIRVTQAPDGTLNPWNHLDFRNDPNAFQFALVSDRTGGARPGIFEDAVRKLNLLQPEFVMSVGDLIEGYSTDRALVNRQWDEFQGFIRQLEMPFFYVPGNHDQSNPMQAAIWKERFGQVPYSFVYRDVLFLCLNSQEPTMHHISDGQAQWVRDTLAANPDARWILVFLHTPLWEEEYPDKSGWTAIEDSLQGRKYTVFAGHFHDYLRRIRHDSRYYILATTGGGSALRGPAYGEFDQVAWVTMTDSGPIVTNLLLDGIRADDIRTPESKDFVDTLMATGFISTDILWHTDGQAPSRQAEVRCANPLDLPVRVTFNATAPTGLAIEISPRFAATEDGRETFVLQPRSTRSLDLRVTGPLPTHPHQAQIAAAIKWEADLQPEGMSPIKLRESVAVPIVPRLVLTRPGTPIQTDGETADWPGAALFDFATPPHLQRGPATWTGPDDCSYRLGVCRDDENLYVLIDVKDDEVVALPDTPPWNQDGIELRIDTRPKAVRNKARQTSEGGLLFMGASPSPADGADPAYIVNFRKLPAGTRHHCRRTATGYVFEAAIPLQALTESGGGEFWRKEGLRLNVAVNDRDGAEQAQLWWQPDWRSTGNLPGSGTFFVE